MDGGEDLYPALIKEVEFIGFYAEEDHPDAQTFEVIVFWLLSWGATVFIFALSFSKIGKSKILGNFRLPPCLFFNSISASILHYISLFSQSASIVRHADANV